MSQPNVSVWGLKAAAVVGMVFGLMTIVSGGNALFGDAAARAAVGKAVPFVLWFNFAAGFVYVVAGAGLLFRRRWALWLSVAILVATILVFIAFAIHAQQGGLYETRTVGAMILRISVWAMIAYLARHSLRG
mgnify:CR=1 FL=1